MDELGVTENITNAWTKTKEFFNTVWDAASPYFDDFVAKTKELGFTGAVIDAWTKVKKFFAELWNNLFPDFEKMLAPLTNIWNKLKSTFSLSGDVTAKNAGLKLPTTQQLSTASGTRNQNNNFEITINANKGDDAESIANKVMGKVSNYSETFLFDMASEAI